MIKYEKLRQINSIYLCQICSFATTFLIAMNFTDLQQGGYGLGMAFNNGTWIAYSIVFLFASIYLCLIQKILLSRSLLNYCICLLILILPMTFGSRAIGYESKLVIFAILSALVMFFIVEQFHSRKRSKHLLIILFLSTLIQTIWGLIQYYLVYEPGLLFLSAESTQPHGTFGQKNVFASYLAFGSLLAIYFLFTAKEKTILLIVFTLIVVVLNAHLTMLAEAKTGRVVPIIAVSIYLGFCAYRYSSIKLVILLFIACIATSFTPKQWFDVRPAQEVKAPIGIQSFGLRPFMYKIGTEIVLDNPATGIGPGNLPREFYLRKAEFEKKNGGTLMKTLISSHIHNEPLQWMIELGVISGFAFIGFFITWVVGLKNGWLEPSILLLGLPFVGHSMLELPFYASAPHLLAFATILALASKGAKKTIKFSPILSGAIIPIAGIISYKAISFLLLSLASMNALMEYRMGNEQDESILYSVEPTPSFERFFTHEKYEWTFRRAMQNGSISKEQVFGYIDFLEENRMKWPEALIYIQLAEMYQISRQPQKAEAIMEEARAFFPLDEKVIAYFEAKEGKN